MSRLLLSCSEDSQAEERAWVLQLLVAGMRSPLDGEICRHALSLKAALPLPSASFRSSAVAHYS